MAITPQLATRFFSPRNPIEDNEKAGIEMKPLQIVTL